MIQTADDAVMQVAAQPFVACGKQKVVPGAEPQVTGVSEPHQFLAIAEAIAHGLLK